MTFEPATAIAIVVPSVTALVWLIRLEGRINTHDVIVSGLRKDITYIRERIDDAIGNGKVRHVHSRHTDGQDDE